MARRFGVPETSTFVDVQSHTIYILDLPIIEVAADGELVIFAEHIGEVWAEAGRRGTPPLASEVAHIAITAGLTENLSEEARRQALLACDTGDQRGAKEAGDQDEEMGEEELGNLLRATVKTDGDDEPGLMEGPGLLDVHADSPLSPDAELLEAIRLSRAAMPDEDKPHPEASSSGSGGSAPPQPPPPR